MSGAGWPTRLQSARHSDIVAATTCSGCRVIAFVPFQCRASTDCAIVAVAHASVTTVAKAPRGRERRRSVALVLKETGLPLNCTTKSHRNPQLENESRQLTPTLWLKCGRDRHPGEALRINRCGMLHSRNTSRRIRPMRPHRGNPRFAGLPVGRRSCRSVVILSLAPSRSSGRRRPGPSRAWTCRRRWSTGSAGGCAASRPRYRPSCSRRCHCP